MPSELETIINAPQQIALSDGRVLDVTPVRVKDLPAFMAAIEPVLSLAVDGSDVLALMVRDSESVIAATAIGLRIPRTEIDEFGLDDLVVCAGKVLEVNADFFAQRVLPAINLTTKRINSLLGGLMQSIGSSRQDTDSPT